jgi:hypothetical protein
MWEYGDAFIFGACPLSSGLFAEYGDAFIFGACPLSSGLFEKINARHFPEKINASPFSFAHFHSRK